MAVLETIRVKFGVLITVLIALALLSFIIDFNSLSSALNSTSSKYILFVHHNEDLIPMTKSVFSSFNVKLNVYLSQSFQFSECVFV